MRDIISVFLNKLANSKPTSAAEKQALYEQWIQSGLTKQQFSQKHGLPKTKMLKWFAEIDRIDAKTSQKASSKTASFESAWVPISPEPESSVQNPAQSPGTTIEIKLPNNTLLHFCVPQDQAIHFFREICHAS